VIVVPTQSLLKRQLTRAFGGGFQIPAEWTEFLTMVDRAYSDFTVDHDLLERALEVSSQELLEVNSEIRAILQAFPDLIFRLGPDGTIRSVKAGAVGNLPQQGFAGRRIQECCFTGLGDQFPELLQRVNTDRSVLSVEDCDGAAGQESWHEVRLVPLPGNEVLAIARNITERKRDEAKLEVMHQQLAEASRQAGTAEIANNVLHNVGNVLNSVNVAASRIVSAMRESRAEGLAKAVELLNEHPSDLADFLSQDPRGRAIPGYLENLATALAAERRSIFDEFEDLTKGIDHIKEIVAAQQSYVSATSLGRPVEVNEPTENALGSS
jgi:PAS domain-containing protein